MKVSRLFLKTLLKLVLLFLLIAVTITVYSGWSLRQRLTEEFQTKGSAISSSVANSALEVILNRDASSVQSLIDQYIEISGVGYVFVVDPEGEIIAHTFVPAIPQQILQLRKTEAKAFQEEVQIPGLGRFTDISTPMLAGAGGAVHVGMDQGIIESHIRSANIRYLNIILVLFLISVAAAYFVTRSIVRPVTEVARVAENVAAGDLTAVADTKAADELAQLIASINSMTSSLNSVVGKVQRSGLDLVEIAQRIAANSRDLEGAVQQLGGFTNEIVVSTSQISATSLQLVQTMKGVSDLVEDAALLASSGKQELIEMQTSFKRSLDLTAEISSSLDEMKLKSENIGIVTTTMAKVADRANLLSLNAAIEAQKAGTTGSGFGVVATEIRRLADQAAVSTLDIERLIADIQTAMNHSVNAVRKFSTGLEKSGKEIRQVVQQLTKVVERVQSLAPSFQVVHEGTTSQAEGAHNIRNLLIQLQETAENTAHAAGEFQQITDNLQTAAESLQQEVSRFKVSH